MYILYIVLAMTAPPCFMHITLQGFTNTDTEHNNANLSMLIMPTKFSLVYQSMVSYMCDACVPLNYLYCPSIGLMKCSQRHATH